MTTTNDEAILFLVVLGGSHKKTNIEMHDVRWVAGKSIEDTIPKLRSQWFGNQSGLHIDSYLAIKYIDGYEVRLVKVDGRIDEKVTSINHEKKNLWFVNLGGYNENRLAELHEFGLVVASSANEAKKVAKRKWLSTALHSHKDNLEKIKSLFSIENNTLLENIGPWRIELHPDTLGRAQEFKPDWFGYWRIDFKS